MRTVIGKTRRGSPVVLVDLQTPGWPEIEFETPFSEQDEIYDGVAVLEAYWQFIRDIADLRSLKEKVEGLAIATFEEHWHSSIAPEMAALGHIGFAGRLHHGKGLLDCAFKR